MRTMLRLTLDMNGRLLGQVHLIEGEGTCPAYIFDSEGEKLPCVIFVPHEGELSEGRPVALAAKALGGAADVLDGHLLRRERASIASVKERVMEKIRAVS